MKTRFGMGCFLAIIFVYSSLATAEPVGITPELSSVEVIHKGKPVLIERNQDNKNTIVDDYALTSRPCPPFCIRPIELAPGVQTVGRTIPLLVPGRIRRGLG